MADGRRSELTRHGGPGQAQRCCARLHYGRRLRRLPSVLRKAAALPRHAVPGAHRRALLLVGSRTGIGIRAADPAHRSTRFDQGRAGLHHLCLRARSARTWIRLDFVAELGARSCTRRRRTTGRPASIGVVRGSLRHAARGQPRAGKAASTARRAAAARRASAPAERAIAPAPWALDQESPHEDLDRGRVAAVHPETSTAPETWAAPRRPSR